MSHHGSPGNSPSLPRAARRAGAAAQPGWGNPGRSRAAERRAAPGGAAAGPDAAGARAGARATVLEVHGRGDDD